MGAGSMGLGRSLMPNRSQEVSETLADSYRFVYAQAVESGERQRRLAQEFSELVATNLREQTEASRSGAQQLSEQASRQQEAGQEFARESVGAYAEFLDDAFSRYQAATERAAGTAAGAVGAATGAVADAAAEGVERTAKTAAFPIAGYDEMNVEEISERLGDLSVEELQLVRDYEELNEKRKTLLEQMDRKIRST